MKIKIHIFDVIINLLQVYGDPLQILNEKNYLGMLILVPARKEFEKNF